MFMMKANGKTSIQMPLNGLEYIPEQRESITHVFEEFQGWIPKFEPFVDGAFETLTKIDEFLSPLGDVFPILQSPQLSFYRSDCRFSVNLAEVFLNRSISDAKAVGGGAKATFPAIGSLTLLSCVMIYSVFCF